MDMHAVLAEGKKAEDQACRYLFWRGWRIAARNWRGGGGELDIVASRWRTLLVVEVRRRMTAREALASIDREKMQRTMRAAQALIRAHDLHAYHLRYDLIAIDLQGALHRESDVLRRGGIIGM